MPGAAMNGVAASADAVARFQHDDGKAGVLQRVRRAEPGGAGADDGDIDFGGEGHGSSGEWRVASANGDIVASGQAIAYSRAGDAGML